MLPEFAEGTGLDVTTLTIAIDASHHSLLLPKVLTGEADGLFGFVNTLASAAIEAGLSPGAFRHFEWRVHALIFAGAAVIASPTLLRSNPAAAGGFVRAVNRALKDVVDDPMSGIEAVRRRSPQIDVRANLARLAGTLAMEMAHEEGERYGVGDTDRRAPRQGDHVDHQKPRSCGAGPVSRPSSTVIICHLLTKRAEASGDGEDARVSGGVSIHAVDVVTGRPAVGMRVELRRSSRPRPDRQRPHRRRRAAIRPHALGDGITMGEYEVVFDIGGFYAAAEPAFLTLVPFRFQVRDDVEHVHLPLKFSPWGIALFRGV